MGFNQKPHDHQQQQQLMGKDGKLSCKVVRNAIPNGTFQLREPDANLESQTYEGARLRDSEVDEDISPCIHRQKHQKGRATAVDETEDFSDIDDIEVSGYLLKEEEKNNKRIIWEALYRDYSKDNKLQVKKPKAAIQKKKDISARTAAKPTKKVEHKRLSAKINYEALAKLNDELIGSPGHKDDVQSRQTSFAMQESERNEQYLGGYANDDVMYGEQDGDIYYEGMDAFDNDEFIDFEE